MAIRKKGGLFYAHFLYGEFIDFNYPLDCIDHFTELAIFLAAAVIAGPWPRKLCIH